MSETMSDALVTACVLGDAAEAERLLDAGVSVDSTDEYDYPALMRACMLYNDNHEACARLLLARGANVNLANNLGYTALMYVCAYGYKAIAKLLCSYGADRDAATTNTGRTAITWARFSANDHLADWLEATREWTTPLHYLDALTPQRAATLLAAGANPHTRATTTAPSPFTLAKAMQQAEGGVVAGSPAAQVILEVEGWEAQNSELMPAEACARGNELASALVLWIGPRFAAGAEGSLKDAWNRVLIPHVLRCEYVAHYIVVD